MQYNFYRAFEDKYRGSGVFEEKTFLNYRIYRYL